jgi:hypothetical protein
MIHKEKIALMKIKAGKASLPGAGFCGYRGRTFTTIFHDAHLSRI